MVSRNGTRKSARVTELRKRIAVPFALRGTARKFLFSISKKDKSQKPYVYFVHPLYNIGSKQWVKTLQATVHAAVARGIIHGRAPASLDWSGREVSYKNLPAVMMFVKGWTGKEQTGPQKYRHLKAVKTTQNPQMLFDVEFRPRRAILEQASVHGQRRQTFTESELAGSGGSAKGSFRTDERKLFEVVMTQREFRQAIARINKRLKAKGLPSLEGLAEMHRQGRRAEAFQMALKATGQRQMAFTEETTLPAAHAYLFYQEAARTLTNKLIARAEKWIERYIPEKER